MRATILVPVVAALIVGLASPVSAEGPVAPVAPPATGEAAGKPREVDLGRPTLPGGTLLEVKAGALALRGGEGGGLRVQLRAGEHTIEVREVHSPPPPALAREAHRAPWPEREVWVFAPDLAHRQVELSGALPVDPSRTNLPQDLRNLSTFQVGAG
ncbi:MAG: hypothetical protein ABTQ29_06550, partial [Siculibacillus sp.]